MLRGALLYGKHSRWQHIEMNLLMLKSALSSAQAFVEAEGDCEERGISAFPVHEVHKIALLDMRLGNCDRNGGTRLP